LLNYFSRCHSELDSESQKFFTFNIPNIREYNQEIKDHEYHFKNTKETKNNNFI